MKLNGKAGRLAIVVKGGKIDSPNVGKILTPIRLASPLEIKQLNISEEMGVVWYTDTELEWTNGLYRFVPDGCIRTLPDVDEDEVEELYSTKELEKTQ